jgi:hypothetical protein
MEILTEFGVRNVPTSPFGQDQLECVGELGARGIVSITQIPSGWYEPFLQLRQRHLTQEVARNPCPDLGVHR